MLRKCFPKSASLISCIGWIQSLKYVFLSGCSNLETAPRISCNMEQLCLDGTAIKELSSSIESPSRLVKLNPRDCLRLESLPSSVCNLESLQKLNLSGLLKVKFVLGIPRNIKVLNLEGTAIKELPSSIGNASCLERLSLKGCSSLESVLGIPRNIKELNLEGTAIKELPSSIGNASRLERLSLKGCSSLESLPTSIVKLSKLKLLDIGYCKSLQSLPKLPSNIEELRAENCKRLKAISGLKNLIQRHCGRTLSFPNCVSLNWNAVRNILHDAALDLYSDEFEVFKYEKDAGKPQGVMCFPGSEIPEWFNIQSSGSVIELPKGSFNHKKFLGFVFCVIFQGQDSGEFLNVEYKFRVKCLNEYMTFDRKLLSVEPTNIKSDHVLLGYNCNTCEVFEFSCDTEAIITFKPERYTTRSGVKIKKCGVRLVFTQEFNEPMKRSKCSIIDEEEVQDEAYSVPRRFRSSNFVKGESSSRCFMIDEEHEEAYSKGCESSDFFKGESSSSSGWHQPQHEKEVEEFNPSTHDFNPSTNEYSRFSSDLNEILNIKIGSTRDVRDTSMLSPADNDGVKLKEVEEFSPSTSDFNPSTYEYSRSSSDSNEILNIEIGSTWDVRGTTMLSPADNDGVKLKGCHCVIL